MEKPIEIAVISGKGGTGKTVLASSLAKITLGSVVADCDVDTPNMHILLNPTVTNSHTFFGDKTAVIDAAKCVNCGDCFRACRFGAIRERDVPEGWAYSIDSLSCEGCAVCTRVCPEGAVSMTEAQAGAWHQSEWDLGPLVHSTLTSAQKNSDELVRILRREARRAAVRQGHKYVIIDGPAGIGAPVIAAILGVALAVVITEPTVSGIHDLRRVVELVHQLGIKMAGVINKHDLNAEVTSAIEEYLSINGIALAGKISFSTEVDRAIADRKFVIDIGTDRVAEEIRQTANSVLMLAGGETQR